LRIEVIPKERDLELLIRKSGNSNAAALKNIFKWTKEETPIQAI
jgi:hypothetical protein